MADLLRGESTLVRDGTDDGAGLQALIASHGQTVGGHVLIALTRSALLAAAITSAVAVAYRLAASRLGHRFGLEGVRLEDQRSQGRGDGRCRNVAGELVAFDDRGELGQIGRGEHIVDALGELLHTGVRQLFDAGHGQRFDLLLRRALDRAEQTLLARGDEEDRLA